jgi:pimeloyl-ACP methyl ester carboxylesterase
MDLLSKWSILSLEEIESGIEAGEDEGSMEQFFGAEESAELHSIVGIPQPSGPREAVVLLPGFMGSLLTSIHGITTLLWINPMLFLKGQTDYLKLNQAGTGDANPDIDTVPLATERIVYLKISLSLRRQVELHEFPYDWRRPIEHNGDLLHEYIERWADGDERKQFTLVGHSMGGLVSRAYLSRHTENAERRIKRLIMLGTPHFGAAGAVENIILGNSMTALASKLDKANDMLGIVRNLPSVYQLLPAPPDLFPTFRHYPVNWDLYDAEAWQVEGIRQDLLDGGKRFHELLFRADPQVETIEIAGCHIETVVDFTRTFDSSGKPHFEATRIREGSDSGDATVPLWSALLPGATVYYTQEKHRNLPKRRRLIEATTELIHGGTPGLPTELPERERGLFAEAAPEQVEEQAAQLQGGIVSGTATAEELSNLYFELSNLYFDM